MWLLLKSLKFKWCHIQRVIPDCARHFIPLCKVLNKFFYPSLLGGPVSELFGLIARFGGLGISDPVGHALVISL